MFKLIFELRKGISNCKYNNSKNFIRLIEVAIVEQLQILECF